MENVFEMAAEALVGGGPPHGGGEGDRDLENFDERRGRGGRGRGARTGRGRGARGAQDRVQEIVQESNEDLEIISSTPQPVQNLKFELGSVVEIHRNGVLANCVSCPRVRGEELEVVLEPVFVIVD